MLEYRIIIKPISYLLFIGIFMFACDRSSSTNGDNGNDPQILMIYDIHTHASIKSDSSAAPLVEQLDSFDIELNIVMPYPKPLVDFGGETDNLESFFSSYTYKFKLMYGGAELQPLLHAVGCPNAFTVENIYPNGYTGGRPLDELMDKMTNIAFNPDKWEPEFRKRATNAAQSGKYVGFGELAPLHYSLRTDHPYITYPVNHPWMLWLSDLAAQYHLVLDIHLEATSETLGQFMDLLEHNRNTKIIWEHAGWSNTGITTAELLSQMMGENSNLYLAVKLRKPETTERNAAHPLDETGMIKSEWLNLLTTYPDRIMVGTDVKYWSSDISLEEEISGKINAIKKLLNQLPTEIAQFIGSETAKSLFGL